MVTSLKRTKRITAIALLTGITLSRLAAPAGAEQAVEQPTGASAAAPAIEYFPQPTQEERRLALALDQRGEIHFSETPLADAMAWFSGILGCSVQLDLRSMEDAGISSDTLVSRRITNASYRAMLRILLDDLDLTFVESDGLLMITTHDAADVMLVTRVYPVADLTPEVPESSSFGHRMGGAHTGPMSIVDDSQAPQSPPAQAAPPAGPPKPAGPPRMVADFDSLIEVITTTVRPQTWDEVGGPGTVSPMSAAKSIVVSQTQQNHRDVLELLRALRSARQTATAK